MDTKTAINIKLPVNDAIPSSSTLNFKEESNADQDSGNYSGIKGIKCKLLDTRDYFFLFRFRD